MGFPVPLVQWMKEDIKDFIFDNFSSQKALNRDLIDNKKVLAGLEKEWKFGRKIWGLLCLEIWQREFFDQPQVYSTSGCNEVHFISRKKAKVENQEN